MTNPQTIFEDGEGILRMAPNWVPRSFCIPGRRLKMHPEDLYAYGAVRGGIDERWFSSTVRADNGPLTLPDEGLSYVVHGYSNNPQKTLFSEMVASLGASLVGDAIWTAYHEWPVFAKFFDNRQALPMHLHHMQQHAEIVGERPKPEAYYFPVQMNNHPGEFPSTYFGLEPGTTREDVKRCLRNWDRGDNGILNLSRAVKLELGTGWDVPAGMLHAPGSLCTFEPQWASDISAMFQSLVNDVPFGWNMLTHYLPEDQRSDLDGIVSLINWEENLNPKFKQEHFLRPKPVRPLEEMQADGYLEQWVVYGNDLFSASELMILPGREIIHRDAGAHGLIAIQGHGSLGKWQVESPALIRFGQLTQDEYFVSARAATQGVRIHNPSACDPLVLLKYYGPGVCPLRLSSQP